MEKVQEMFLPLWPYTHSSKRISHVGRIPPFTLTVRLTDIRLRGTRKDMTTPTLELVTDVSVHLIDNGPIATMRSCHIDLIALGSHEHVTHGPPSQLRPKLLLRHIPRLIDHINRQPVTR